MAWCWSLRGVLPCRLCRRRPRHVLVPCSRGEVLFRPFRRRTASSGNFTLFDGSNGCARRLGAVRVGGKRAREAGGLAVGCETPHDVADSQSRNEVVARHDAARVGRPAQAVRQVGGAREEGVLSARHEQSERGDRSAKPTRKRAKAKRDKTNKRRSMISEREHEGREGGVGFLRRSAAIRVGHAREETSLSCREPHAMRSSAGWKKG